MLKLIWRQFRKTILVQAAMIVLFASAVVAFMLYGAYIEREGSKMSVRLESRIAPGHYLVTTKKPMAPDQAPLVFVSAWSEAHVNSNRGELPVTFLHGSARVMDLLSPGEAAVHANLARRLGLVEGDTVKLNTGAHFLDVKVARLYEGIPRGLGFDHGERVLVHSGQHQLHTNILFERTHPNATWFYNQLKSSYPDARIEDAAMDMSLGARLVKNNYELAKQAQFSLVLFVMIAFLTAKVMTFMDGRKTLAILKAMGLKNVEVGGAIAFEALLSPVAGAVCGGLAGSYILHILKQQGTGLVMAPALLINAVLCLVPAAVVGIIIPGRFAQMGSVNELLFERTISLLHETVRGVSRHYPALDPYVARGVHFIKLDIVGDNFEGYIFRHLGDTVKQGEVIAVGSAWWGLKSKQFVAPVSGTIVYFQPDTGFIGVGPAELLSWQPERAAVVRRLVTASQD